MKEDREQQFKNYLKRNMTGVDTKLGTDLWPRMLHRLDERSTAQLRWLDWALLGLLATLLASVPGAIPLFLYQF